MRTQRRRCLLPLLAAAVLATGCGGDGGGGDDRAVSRSTTTLPAPKPAPTSSTTEPAESTDGYVKVEVDPSLPRQDIDINMRYPATFTEEQIAVVEAWAGYRHVFLSTLDPPDPSSQLMEQYATPEIVALNLTQRIEMAEQGIVVKVPPDGPTREAVTSVTVRDRRAEAVVCRVDAVLQVRAIDGQVVNDEVSTKSFREFLTLQENGKWKVSPPAPEELGRWNGDQEERCLAEP